MSTSASRGQDIRNYIPALKKGAVIPLACLSAGFTTGVTAGGITSAHLGSKAVVKSKMNMSQITGTIAADSTTYAIAHGLSATPSIVIVTLRSTAAKLNQSASACVGEASASARTSTNVYIAGSAGTGYCVVCLV